MPSAAATCKDYGSAGESYDNALTETINGLYKTEVVHLRGSWRSVEAVEFATLTLANWFNNRRLLDTIGEIPPAVAEERDYAILEQPDMAARGKRNGLRQSRSGPERADRFDTANRICLF